jgi:hypothetical protein
MKSEIRNGKKKYELIKFGKNLKTGVLNSLERRRGRNVTDLIRS